jgi:hypothetical protein
VKRTGRGEPIGVVLNICMETTQGNSLCSCLDLKLAKISCSSFYLLCFFSYKIGEQEARIGSAQEEGLVLVGGGRWQGKE